jgi:YbbR domain-containing protein
VRVSIVLRPVTATRTYQVGLDLVGARSDRIYSLSTDQVLLTIGGSVADLNRLEGANLVATLDVTDLTTGTGAITVQADLPAGVAFVSASPDKVSVTVTIPPPASPSAGPPGTISPSASPSG